MLLVLLNIQAAAAPSLTLTGPTIPSRARRASPPPCTPSQAIRGVRVSKEAHHVGWCCWNEAGRSSSLGTGRGIVINLPVDYPFPQPMPDMLVLVCELGSAVAIGAHTPFVDFARPRSGSLGHNSFRLLKNDGECIFRARRGVWAVKLDAGLAHATLEEDWRGGYDIVLPMCGAHLTGPGMDEPKELH